MRIRSQIWALFHCRQLQSACSILSGAAVGTSTCTLIAEELNNPSPEETKPANNEVLQLTISLVQEMAIFDHTTPPFGGLPSGGELAQHPGCCSLGRAAAGQEQRESPGCCQPCEQLAPYARVFRLLWALYEGNRALHLHKMRGRSMSDYIKPR